MLDALRNISILNHFLQNVTCSMWVFTAFSSHLAKKKNALALSSTYPNSSVW